MSQLDSIHHLLIPNTADLNRIFHWPLMTRSGLIPIENIVIINIDDIQPNTVVTIILLCCVLLNLHFEPSWIYVIYIFHGNIFSYSYPWPLYIHISMQLEL